MKIIKRCPVCGETKIFRVSPPNIFGDILEFQSIEDDGVIVYSLKCYDGFQANHIVHYICANQACSHKYKAETSSELFNEMIDDGVLK